MFGKSVISGLFLQARSVRRGETMNNVPRIITIKWDGPFSLDQLAQFNRSQDYGLYQIYGTHNIFGPNSLLYLGKAEEQSFADRIPAHIEWIEWEPSSNEIYFGRLCSTEPMTEARDTEWCTDIDVAERLLIYFSSPPYNSKNIHSYGDITNVIVINYKKRNRLPIEVSTFYEDTVKNPQWHIYGEESAPNQAL